MSIWLGQRAKDYHDGDLHYIVRSFITFRQTFQDKLRQSMGEELKELFVGFYKPSLDVFVPEQSVRWGRGRPMSRSQSRIIWIGLFGFNQSLSSGVSLVGPHQCQRTKCALFQRLEKVNTSELNQSPWVVVATRRQSDLSLDVQKASASLTSYCFTAW